MTIQPLAVGAYPLRLAGRTILQIIPNLDAGGAERTTVDIAAALVQSGARALVATESGRLVPELQARGGIWIPFPAATKNPFKMLANITKLTTLCRDEKVDLIHARSRAPAWTALASARHAELPFVTTYHGSYSGKSVFKIIYNSVMARGDVVIANSHYTAGLIRTMHPFASDRIRVVHRGTDMQVFARKSVASERIDRLKQAWGATPDRRIILLAARLTGWKGQKVLIEAARILVDRGLDDSLVVLAGDPQGREDYVRELDALTKRLGLERHVKRVGHCADMPAAFLAASAVAVASIEPEAFGRSAVEAQAMGVPVVVTALGAIPETVLAPPDIEAELRTGWRVPPGDAAAMANALHEALTLSPVSQETLATRSRNHVESQFSLEGMTGATLRLYEGLFDRENRRKTV